jgi:hypothetical protein
MIYEGSLIIEKLKKSLGEDDFQKFLKAKKPLWIQKLILEVEK